MSAAGYDYFDVAADVGVKAWGSTLSEAFAQAALGVFALIVDPESAEPRESREVRAQGETREALLVNWLNECLYVHDIEAFVVNRIEFLVFEPTRVHACLWGEDLNPGRHRLGTVVKAATFHQVQVRETDGRWEIRVVLDV
ncbi:MAG: archease [Candidatus Rokubacteria bacterium]|nr:archease [Candidatus Rokubacteria bacterium]